MKRCPQCRRDYYDDSLLYCLDDGSALLEGPGSMDDAKTAVLSDPDAPTVSFDDIASHSDRGRGSFFKALNRNRTRAAIAGLGLVAVLGLGGYAIYRNAAGTGSRSETFRTIKLSRATNEGNVDSVAISPDGKYLAYVTVDGEKRTLWSKQVATSSRVQVATYTDLSELFVCCFTPDSNYLLFAIERNDSSQYELFQVPVLGGTARKLVSNVLPQITFSPEGKRIAYSRLRSAPQDFSVAISQTDGGDEKTLLTRPLAEAMAVYGLAWSPDGKTLVTAAYSAAFTRACKVMGIEVSSGNVNRLSPKDFSYLGRFGWLPDGSGLMFIGRDGGFDVDQVWYMSYPAGETRRVTNDLNDYANGSLTLTADGKTLAVLQRERVPLAYIAPTSDMNSLRRLSAGNDRVGSLSWDRSGRLFYVSGANAETTWVLEPNSDSPRIFTEGTGVGGMLVTPDGRFSIFVSNRSGARELWRANIDGSNPKQLTQGVRAVEHIAVSPDSSFVIFTQAEGNIWKVPIDGGAATVFAETPGVPVLMPQFSPDGRKVLGVTFEDGKNVLRLFDVEGEGARLFKTIELPGYGEVRWSPDGQSVVFRKTVGRVSNLWQQPLDGGKPKQITNYTSDTIVDFAFSPDGKQIALARGPTVSDAVLIVDQDEDK
jgi:Tol biopolymer transport system component